MTRLKFSCYFIFLFVFGFLCLANGNPISNFFGKSSDDKAEADEKTSVSAAPIAKAGETTTTTTTTPEPSSSCGGLKGFLHICDKNAPTEPPKSVKTRSVSDDSDEDDDDDSKSDEDDDDDDDDDDSDEKPANGEEKPDPTETSSVSGEPTEGEVVKRQVGDPGAPVLGEIPPVIADAMEVPEKPEENKEKRQADDKSNSDEDSDESIEYSRRRRDCRDRQGDFGKDCRRKREYVPSCFGPDCKLNETVDANQ